MPQTPPTMSRRDAIAEAILSTKPLMMRYLAGFTDENHTRQTTVTPNHVAWCLGHSALTMHRLAEKIDGRPLPDADFSPTTVDSPDKPPTRYWTESVAFNSHPRDDKKRYPALPRCIAIYEGAVDRLADAVRHADEAKLDTRVPWGPTESPLWLLATRMIFHNGTHTGQIIDLRRGLQMGRVLA